MVQLLLQELLEQMHRGLILLQLLLNIDIHLTNNNARPIDINAGSTWGTMAIEVPVGGQIISDFGTRGFTAMVVREILQGAAGTPTPAAATMNMQGVGNVTPPANAETCYL